MLWYHEGDGMCQCFDKLELLVWNRMQTVISIKKVTMYLAWYTNMAHWKKFPWDHVYQIQEVIWVWNVYFDLMTNICSFYPVRIVLKFSLLPIITVFWRKSVTNASSSMKWINYYLSSLYSVPSIENPFLGILHILEPVTFIKIDNLTSILKL